MICDALYNLYGDKDFIKGIIKSDEDIASSLKDNLDDYIDAYENALKELNLSGKNSEMTVLQDDIDTIKELRDIFNEELGYAMESLKTGRSIDEIRPDTEETSEGTMQDLPDFDVEFSTKDNVANLKKMGYNQYRSEKLAFEHGSAPTGTQKMFYNPQKNQFEVWEKGDDALLIMGAAKRGKEAEKLYEQTYRNAANEIRRNYESAESSKGKSNWDNVVSENRGNDVGNVAQTESEGFQGNARGSGSNLLESNNGKSISNEPSSTDGGFSMPKFSAKDTEYLKAVESGDMETAQRMVDEAAKEAGYTVKAHHGTSLIIPFGEKYPNGSPFYIFNKSKDGIHFGTKEQARNRLIQMEGKLSGGGYVKDWIYDVYLNLGKSKVVTDAGLDWETEISQAISEGYNSLTYENKHEGGGLSYCVFDPSQIKSADPITYDNSGNIIPLSERFNEKNDDIRRSTKNSIIQTVASTGDYSSETDSNVVINDLMKQNDFTSFVPDEMSLSEEFIKAIKSHGNFMYPRLYRGMDANEFEYIRDNGFIKSNSSYNFEYQQGQTLFSSDPRYAFGYATSFAPADIRKNLLEKGKPAYLVEIANTPDINIKKDLSLGNEEYTYGEVESKYITRVFEIRYKEDTDSYTMKDATAESGIIKADSSKVEVVHGVPDFYRDETTGTILYNVQDEDGNGTEQYISEAEPGLIIDYSKLEDAPEYEIKYKTKAAKISGKYSDLRYIEPGRASNDDIRYSRKLITKDPKKLTEEDALQLLKYAKQRMYDDGTYIPVRINTPEIIIEAAHTNHDEVSDSPMAMSVYKARQAMASLDEWDGKPGDKPHEMTNEDVITAIKAIDNPLEIYFEENTNKYVAIVKLRKGDSRKVFVIIDTGIENNNRKNPDVMNGYSGDNYNITVTVYPAESKSVLEKYRKNKRNIPLYNREKGFLRGSYGSKLPSLSNRSPFFIDNTTPPSSKSQSLFSTKDSEGNKLTEQQAEYFKDSKVRDEDGNLRVVYHGTDAEFTVFDILKAGKNGRAEGYGFYFTDDKTITNKYGNNQITSYLNITKPLYDNRITLKKRELEKLVSAVIDYETNRDEIEWQDSFISNYVNTYGYGDRASYIKEFVNSIWQFNENDQDLIYEIANGAALNYDVEGIKDFYNILYNAIGVDGNISTWNHADGESTIYVAFRPEQIKEINNKTPTENPDIFLSTKSDSSIDKYYDKLRTENKYLQNILTIMDERFESVRNTQNPQHTELKQADIDKIAKKILKGRDSKYDLEDFSNRLKSIYDYMLSGEFGDGFDTDAVMKALIDLAKTS